MKTLSMSVDHKRVFFMFVIMLATLSFLLVAFGLISLYFLYGIIEYEKYILFAPSYMTINSSQTLCLLTFILILYSVYIRFDLINNCIKKHFAMDEDETKSFAKKSSTSLSHLVLKLSDAHDSLVDVSTQINYCFAFQMMNVVAGMFCSNIFSTFAIYRVFVRKDFKDFYNASIQYAWNIYFMTYGVGILALASLMTRTGKYTAVLVHKAINFIDDDDDPIIDYVRQSN